MGGFVDSINSINDSVNEYESMFAPGGTSGATDLASCLTKLIGSISQLSMASANPMQSAALAKLFEEPISQFNQVKEAALGVAGDLRDLFKEGESVDGVNSLMAGGLDVVLSPLYMQAALLENLTQTFVDQLAGDNPLSALQKSFVSQVKNLFGNGGLISLATIEQLAALLYYAVGEQLPAIDQQRTIVRSMRKNLKLYRKRIVQLPPSMIPGIPNSLAIKLLCEAEIELKITKGTLQRERRLDRPRVGTAGTKVCQAKDAVGGDMSNLPAFLQSQVQNMYGLSDLQFKTLRDGKFMPDPRFRLTQIMLMNQNAQLQALDVSLVAFNKNLKGIEASLNLNLQIADVFATLVEVLIRAIQTCRAQLEASGAGFEVTPQLARMTGGTPTAEYTRGAAERGRNPAPNDIAGLGRSSDTSLFGGIGNALQTQYSVYVQLVVLCALLESAKSALPAVERILKANDRLGRLLRKIAIDLACVSETSGAKGVDVALKRLIEASERRLKGTSTGNDEALAACDALDRALKAHERWLKCMDDACHGVINAFGLGPFADILVLAGKIAYMARRVAALADSLATFDYSKVFNSAGSMNFWDLIIQSLQCLLQCDNPKIKTLLDDQFSMMKGLQGKLEASMLSLPVLRSLHQNNASRGANNRNSNLLKLIRSLQALTSMSLADLCALPTPENPRPAQAPIMQPPNPAVLANPALEAARQAKITNARSFVGSVPYPP